MLIGSYIPAEEQLCADSAIEVHLGRQLLNDCCLLPPLSVYTSAKEIANCHPSEAAQVPVESVTYALQSRGSLQATIRPV